jgi:phosphoglycerate dehydrogenase-like enzyme
MQGDRGILHDGGSNQKGDPDDPVFRYNVLATPHIAGSTDVSISGIVKVVAENIRRLERGQEWPCLFV